jgi:hypothetical protein
MFGVLRKVGSGFKWLGKKALWVLRRNETLFAISLADDILPIPALDKIVLLVRAIDHKNKSGEEKMAEALEKLPAILKEFGLDITSKSEAKLAIELAVAIMKKRARVIPQDE